MKTKKCNWCGGQRFVADRALAGKLICSKCGKNYGSGIQRIENKFLSKVIINKHKKLLLYFFGIIIFIIIFS